ncbi:hypothetical protein IAD21_00582 [Abditibacteriota bacterium]|nr:hypothetical protein IAD21_00582 [Abditibacteriota bacterium]
MARPKKFSQIGMSAIITALKNGTTRKDAAKAAGVSYETLRAWVEQGQREPEGEFSAFSVAVERSEAECANKMARAICDAAKEGDWRAAESWLKRRRRDEWGDNVRVDVDDEITNLMAQLAAKRQAETP